VTPVTTLVHDALHLARRETVSPSRNPRTAVVIGRLLGAGFVICFATGVYSHLIQEPPAWMAFPVRPVWLYQLTQGAHVVVGTLCIPLLLGKLHAVYPQLFQTPLVRSVPHLLERASIALFVAVSLVQLAIGLVNTFQWYVFPFPFRQVHFALSFVLIGSLALHIGVKLPVIARNWRRRDALAADGVPIERADTAQQRDPDAARLAGTAVREDAGGRAYADGRAPGGVTGRLLAWVDREPAPTRDRPARTSRRGFLAAIGAGVGALFLLTAGQTLRPFEATNLFGPRVRRLGPQSLPVNQTAREAGVEETAVAPDWTLTVASGDAERRFGYAELAALEQVEVDLPIACVEGWSSWATWRGVRLGTLLDLVDAPADATVRFTSLEEGSPYGVSHMGPEFARDDLTLVALQLNGEALDLDHGYPARVIAPARPGVLQTKWLSRLETV
jgi:hypothetical protein